MFLVELVYYGIFNEFFCYFYVESLVVIVSFKSIPTTFSEVDS